MQDGLKIFSRGLRRGKEVPNLFHDPVFPHPHSFWARAERRSSVSGYISAGSRRAATPSRLPELWQRRGKTSSNHCKKKKESHLNSLFSPICFTL